MGARSFLVRGLRRASGASQALAHGLRKRTTGLVAGARRRLSPPRPGDKPGPQS